MDLNSKDFPILSYLLSRFPQPNSFNSEPNAPEIFISRMPHFTHPKVLNTMIQAISDTTPTLSILQTLGPRPGRSTVDAARAKIAAAAESKLPEHLSVNKFETEMEMYKAVVRLDDMHEVYASQLRDVEQILVGVYDSVVGELEKGGDVESDEMNEEVVGILLDAEREGVERIELSERQLRFLPEAFGKLRGLLVLNLSHNQFEIIPDSIAGLRKLEELDVSSNLLESLPDSIGLLLNLKILDVSGNKLSALPETIVGCISLQELDASFNNLTYLPTNIGYGLVNLRKFLLHLNKIHSLPISFCEMTSLTHLDLHFNELRGLPHAIGRLTNLEILNLSSNFSDLTELPETIGDLTNLRELDVSNNQIQALPHTFGRLEKLTKLNLDQNLLVVPPIDVGRKGVEAVKEFMAKRLLDIITEEQQRSVIDANKQAQAGWLGWSTSSLNGFIFGVSQSVGGYLGGGKAPKDSYLDQEL